MRWPWQPQPELPVIAVRAKRAEDLTAQGLDEMRALIAELRALIHQIDNVAPPPQRGPLNV